MQIDPPCNNVAAYARRAGNPPEAGVARIASLPARFEQARLVARSVVALLIVPLFVHATTVDSESTSKLKLLSLEELMNIEVTSVSRQPEKLAESASAIQVVTGEDIRRSGVSSIPEALRLADNLDVAQKNSHDWAIAARGFNTELANKLLVLIDGRSIYTPLFSGVFWNVQDYLLEDLDRIEVISGPGGALWGANAVNGVINITSKSAKDTQGLYLEGGGGSRLREFGAVRYGGTLAPNVYYRIYGKHFERGPEADAAGNASHDAWSMTQGGFRIDALTSPENVFTLQGDIYGSNVDIPLPSSGTGKASGGNILGRWSRVFSPESDMKLQFYYDRTHLYDPIFNQFGPVSILTDDLDTYDLDFQHRFTLGERHRLVWGLGYRFTHDVVDPAATLGFVPPILDRTLFGGFVQDEIKLRSNLALTFGTKLEHNDYTGFETEPSCRLQWSAAANQMVWAAISRAVRTPSRVDSDIQEPVSATPVLAGNTRFASETVIAYELGYRAQLGTKATVSISAFYNDYDHVRSLDFTPVTIIPLFFANGVQGRTHGVELSATYQLSDWWRLRAGCIFLREHLSVKPGQVDLENALNETADPSRQFSLHSSMDLPGSMALDAGLRWVDTRPINNSGVLATVPSYFEMDVRLGWHPAPGLEFSIVGQNLLHDHHAEYGVPGPNREEMQRGVFGKVTWHF